METQGKFISLFDGELETFEDADRLAHRLYGVLKARRDELIRLHIEEVCLTQTEAEETLEGCLAVLHHFRSSPFVTEHVPSCARRIDLHESPWGTVVAILPQNAFLFLGLVVLFHAADGGNRVVLRAPSGCGGLAAVLKEALEGSGHVVVQGSASELLRAFYGSDAPGLVHYFGGSGRAPEMLAQAFSAGKGLIIDGSGNTWAYGAAECDPESTSQMLATGATRYGGQTCTSINGAIIHPAVYSAIERGLIDLLKDVAPDSETGGVLARSGGQPLCPALVATPSLDSDLVSEGIYGPAMWILKGDAECFRRLWLRNRFPLCAAVFGDPDAEGWVGLRNLARLVIDGDPSLEDPLEPWGGYPLSGNSSVGAWRQKYRRIVQIDRPSLGLG